MKFTLAPALLALLSASCSHAFTLPQQTFGRVSTVRTPTFVSSSHFNTQLRASSDTEQQQQSSNTVKDVNGNIDQVVDDNEVERLRNMAAQLRAEAARLEADQQRQMAEAAQRAFEKFDTNRDGKISLAELKEGLERAFKTELPESRVRKLMQDFDKTGDGSLELDEFVTVDQFRNKLDALAREEKAQAAAKTKQAQLEQEAVKFLQAQLSLINDAPPSNTDKLVSILPYLFPLLDGLQFARFFVVENPDNPLSIVIAIAYGLYRSIPFGGLIAFFALSFLAGNPTINRLVRFNMQQAIFIDIALFFPGLLAAIYGLLAGSFQLPTSLVVLGNDVLFFTLVATIGYCTVSSLLGITPDKIPLISSAVNSRLPTIDMFDANGMFIPKNQRELDRKEKESKKDDDDKKKDE